LDAESWDRLPDRFGFDHAQESEWRDLLAALRRAVDTELTPVQPDWSIVEPPPPGLAPSVGVIGMIRLAAPDEMAGG
jgi:hypothetical protein